MSSIHIPSLVSFNLSRNKYQVQSTADQPNNHGIAFCHMLFFSVLSTFTVIFFPSSFVSVFFSPVDDDSFLFFSLDSSSENHFQGFNNHAPKPTHHAQINHALFLANQDS
jgi:hypothetical protein